MKSLFADEGKHGGEVTVEAVKLIADHVKVYDCQLHPDCIEVCNFRFYFSSSFLVASILLLFLPVQSNAAAAAIFSSAAIAAAASTTCYPLL